MDSQNYEYLCNKINLGFFHNDVKILNKKQLLEYIHDFHNEFKSNQIRKIERYKNLKKQELIDEILFKKFELLIFRLSTQKNFLIDLCRQIYKYAGGYVPGIYIFDLRLWTQMNRCRQIQWSRQIQDKEYFWDFTDNPKKFLLHFYPQFTSQIIKLNKEQCQEICKKEIDKIVILKKMPYEILEEVLSNRKKFLKYLHYNLSNNNSIKKFRQLIDELILDCPKIYLYTKLIV